MSIMEKVRPPYHHNVSLILRSFVFPVILIGHALFYLVLRTFTVIDHIIMLKVPALVYHLDGGASQKVVKP